MSNNTQDNRNHSKPIILTSEKTHLVKIRALRTTIDRQLSSENLNIILYSDQFLPVINLWSII